MSVASASPSTNLASASGRGVFVRTLWKEYRMLRGFWCGIGGLAILAMFGARVLAPATQWADATFAIAWAAAALYVVGAAVTLFSVEREEGTTKFLERLPESAWPLLAGKLALAAGSAVALAIVLAAIGVGVAGRLPADGQLWRAAGQGLLVIFEALAWGVLASLVIPQPLLAAIAGIGLASLSAQLAITLVRGDGHGFSLTDFAAATPLRLALATAVGAWDVWRGLAWLRAPDGRRPGRGPRVEMTTARVATGAATASRAPATARSFPRNRSKLFGRLVWQSWREGWRPMAAAIVLGVFLVVAIELTLAMLRGTAGSGGRVAWLPEFPLSLLVTPALVGAMAFRADQRLDRRQFLAERGAPAWLVWLARQVVWLTPIVLIGAAFHLAAWIAIDRHVVDRVVATLTQNWFPYYLDLPFVGDGARSTTEAGFELRAAAKVLVFITVLAWTAWLTAYAIGQLMSLVVRRDVLAGFLAILAAVLLNVWSYVCIAWNLPATVFVAPVGAGALGASLLGARAWLVARRTWSRWILPGAAIVAPLVFIAMIVPAVRVWQIKPLKVGEDGLEFIEEPLATTLARWEAEAPAAKAVAQEYARIAASRYKRPESGRAITDDYAAYLEEIQPQLDAVSETSQAPRCRLTFAPTATLLGRPGDQFYLLVDDILADAVRQTRAGNLDRAAQRLLTFARMEAHAGQYQSFWAAEFFRRRLGNYRPTTSIEGAQLEWLQAPGQTSERVRALVAGLEQAERMYPPPREHVVAAHLDVTKVLNGAEPASFLDRRGRQAPAPIFWEDTLTLLAQQFEWEQTRSHAALRTLTDVRLDYVYFVELRARETRDRTRERAEQLRSSLHSWNSSSTPQVRVGRRWSRWYVDDAVRAARTSYLAARELDRRDGGVEGHMVEWVERLAKRRLEIARAAAVAYRLDRDEYPAQLADLAPKYAKAESLLDPFSHRDLRIRRKGFRLPLTHNYWYDAEDVSPGTPFMWSVWTGDIEPEAVTVRYAPDEDGKLQELDAGDPPVVDVVTRREIRMRLDNDLWWSRSGVQPFLPLPVTLPSTKPDAVGESSTD